MEVLEREILLLVTPGGKTPFEEWLSALGNETYRVAVDARLVRVADGNFGDHKSVGGGVFELRVPKGPGLRIYYGLETPKRVVIISGGDKGTQKRDIQRAKKFWSEYRDAE